MSLGIRRGSENKRWGIEMTVAELIEKLSQYPSGAEVMVRNESDSWVDIGKVDYDEVTNEILLWRQKMKPDSEIVLKGEDARKFREMLFDSEAIEERDAFIAEELPERIEEMSSVKG